jgi:cholesterol oxidase
VLRARPKRFAALPRYIARLPWIGPIQGGFVPEDPPQHVRLGAACDPLIGKALLAACLPVRRRGCRFDRLPGTGWIVPVDADAQGRFRVEAPLDWWQSAPAGVLMALLYDRSATVYDPEARINVGRGFPVDWAGQLAHFKSALPPTAVAAIAGLPDRIPEEIEQRLAELLAQPAADLEEGLIELATPAPDTLTFAVASCQYPANFLDGDVATSSYARLRRRVEAPDAPSRPACLLLIGDQVYIDATAGLFDPSALSDRYDLPYERLLRTKPLRHILRRVPLYTMLDDHEIEDNWEPPSGDPKSLDRGREYYLAYQRMAEPRPAPADRLWYAFNVGRFPFFMADTRTERDPRTAERFADARIMKEPQFKALTAWLDGQKTRNVPMFIASPASFLPRHRKATHGPAGAGALHSDGWDGYPKSFHAVVEHIARNAIRNVVFLSGDEHISFATTAAICDGRGNEVTRFHSIHSSGLYAPFSFANSSQDNLACCEVFSSGPYTCHVSTEFAPAGDGFALLHAAQDNGGWRIRCLFDREAPEPERWIDLV